MISMRHLALALCACGLLAGCDTWLGENAKPPLPGKRISVLAHARGIETDSAGEASEVLLPPPENVADWPQAGGYPPHAMHHLVLGDRLRQAWSSDIGDSGDRRRVLLTQPVVAGGVAFTLDVEGKLSAFRLKDGDRLWRTELAPEDADEGSLGGGIAYDDGRLYVTTGYSEVVTVEPRTGKVLWRKTLPAPVRGAPTVRAGRILMITVENQTLALAADDGHELWHHNGLAEGAAMLGGNSPAVDGNIVIVTYSSGEVFALRIENGTAIWNDVLSGIKRTDQVATLTDIRGLPVIYDGRVYVAGNSEMLAAIDLRSGRRIWEREVGAIKTPWIAGDYLYLLSNNAELLCFDAKSGRVLWVTPLQAWRNEEEKRGRIVWTGPVLASDRLIVASSEGEAIALSPYTGKMLGRIEVADGVNIAPIVADGTLLFLTSDGDLVAYR